MTVEPLLVFGEVLFDHFPDGRSVLGGAPFNVAWHLQAFGEAPRLISRIGDDADGQALRQAMNRWGMDATGLQTDTRLPTGRVEVSLVDGEPHYEIVHPVAWDAIEPVASRGGGWLYHGSLALRDARSRAALDALAAAPGVRIFLDVNLREPWWDRDALLERIHAAHWVKLNEDELRRLAPEVPDEEGAMDARARALLHEADLDGLVVTLGAAGALVLDRDENGAAGSAAERATVVDTVGAGDAFTSVMILGLRRGWPLDAALERALVFGAAVCGLRGATVADPDFYQPFFHDWRHAGNGAA